MLWSIIRQVAASSGVQLEESRGFFQRSFVLRGTLPQLQRAADELLQYEEFRKGLVQ